jgi:hypothetical protein
VSLNARACLALVVVTLVMCALLFGSAETIRYWQAWVYVAIFVVASVPTSVYLMKKDPPLLARRMRGGPMFEKEGTQRFASCPGSIPALAAWRPALLSTLAPKPDSQGCQHDEGQHADPERDADIARPHVHTEEDSEQLCDGNQPEDGRHDKRCWACCSFQLLRPHHLVSGNANPALRRDDG